MNIEDSNIAIIHNWFRQKSVGGSEKVLRKFNPELLNEYSQKFSIENFVRKFDFAINKAWGNFNKKHIQIKIVKD